ncbi:hypothetical protein LNV47_25385, partial [Paucibacter sp. DJ4R-1]|nr:hypothetical protein [Paucibacter sp. DJ4R-1]
MAPASVVSPQPTSHLHQPRLDSDAAALRRRNEELERELKESKLREERMKEELRKAWERVRVA